ncbi:hypothetical protein CVT26_004734 [Gymnopilus dilepis]|uniref:F-box domain-containing protein n=1 Tax=Gymnopilus dilepis TaxID=231916 RepID=A0A409XZ91_9AGAR|nr:hypothetical protein CVT26_004734 [Gymnopilus dilepis]
MAVSADSSTMSELTTDLDQIHIRHSSPISTLHEDVLGHIFLLNTDMGISLGDAHFWAKTESAISALDTTLISSRVCRRWRSLLLDWPIIWGRSLHLDRLCKLGEEGWKEIIRRTGAAPLWLVGYIKIDPSTDFVADVFVPLVQANWCRVQTFCVCIRDDEGMPPPELFQVFTQSAPMLEIFALQKKNAGEGVPLSASDLQGVRLFNGSAPRLCFLCNSAIALTMPNIGHASWLGQLRLLKLSDLKMPPIELLAVLRCTPLLESLYLRWLPWSAGLPNADAIESHSINLPHLVNLRACHSFHVDLALIRIIRPSRDCSSFKFLPVCPAETISQEDVAATIEALTPYLDGYFSFRKVRSASIWASPDVDIGFEMNHAEGSRDENRPRDTNSRSSSPLTINLSSLAGYPPRPDLDPDSLIAALLKPHLAQLSSVQNLNLILSCHDKSCVALETTMEALQGVESLTISKSGLHVLDRYLDDNTKVFFPRLQKLIVKLVNDGWPVIAHVVKDIFVKLLSGRGVACILPVRYLEFDRRPFGDWSFLDEFDGLTVTLPGDNRTLPPTIYVCGTGSPETLNADTGREHW